MQWGMVVLFRQMDGDIYVKLNFRCKQIAKENEAMFKQ